jgi:hypothetical protein
MQHLLALLRQSHNGLDFDQQGKLVRLTQLPLVFYAFPEGLYIVDATDPYEDLIGARVLRSIIRLPNALCKLPDMWFRARMKWRSSGADPTF